MDYSKTKGIEIGLSNQTEYSFKFGINIAVTATIRNGKTKWTVAVTPKVPKPIGRPRKIVPEQVPFKFVKAMDLQQVYEPHGEVDFLKHILRNGPVDSGEIFAAATSIGWNKGNIFRAAKLLAIRKYPVGHGKAQKWVWELQSDKQTNLAHEPSRDAGSMDAQVEESVIDPPGYDFGRGKEPGY